MTTQIVALLVEAAAAVVRAFPADAAAVLQEVADRGDLSLEVTAYPDGAAFGEFFDLGAPPCWDHCNGITTVHRAGWCRVNPEHADLDCYCGVPPEAWDDDDDDVPESNRPLTVPELHAMFAAVDEAKANEAWVAAQRDDEPF